MRRATGNRDDGSSIVIEAPSESSADQGNRGPGIESDRLEKLILTDCIKREGIGRATDGTDDHVDSTERIDGLVGENRHGRFAIH